MKRSWRWPISGTKVNRTRRRGWVMEVPLDCADEHDAQRKAELLSDEIVLRGVAEPNVHLLNSATSWKQRDHLYIIQSETGHVKIGRTEDLKQRVKALSHMSPVALSVLVVLHGRGDQESRLHRMFKPERLHGEWFFPSQRLADFVSALRSVTDNNGDPIDSAAQAAGIV